MEMGGDVKGVFSRLARGIKAVEDSVRKESGRLELLWPEYLSVFGKRICHWQVYLSSLFWQGVHAGPQVRVHPLLPN